MKKIKIGIFIVIAIIIAILITIFIIKQKKDREEKKELENIYTTEEYGTFDDEDLEFSKEKDINTFFSVEGCIRKFINKTNTQKETETNFFAINILSKYFDDVNIYIINGLQYEQEGKILQKNYIMYLDNENNTYSIISTEETELKKIKESAVNNKVYEIKNNEDNIFDFVKKDDNIDNYAFCIKKYFEFYNNMILNYPEIIYNNYFEDEYKQKRFGSFETLKKYVEKNEDELNVINPNQYMVEEDENEDKEKETYLCLDQYNNTYEIFQNSIMDFKIRLDTYTILTNNFKESYDSAKDSKKVQMNIDKWVQMLNSRDYKTAYERLDETFRNNNFGSVEKFEEYMREKYPYHYGIEFNSSSKEGNIYTQKVTLREVTGSEEENVVSSLNVIMKLEDNYNYVMSFEVQK